MQQQVLGVKARLISAAPNRQKWCRKISVPIQQICALSHPEAPGVARVDFWIADESVRKAIGRSQK